MRPVHPGQIVYPTDRVQQPSDTELLLNGKSEHRVPVKSLPANAPKPGGIDADYGHVLR